MKKMKAMAAYTNKNVRLRLSFDISPELNLSDVFHPLRIDPRWFLLTFESLKTVDDVKEEIKRRVKLKPECCVELLLDGIRLDVTEDSAIFRENDSVLVRCCSVSDDSPSPSALATKTTSKLQREESHESGLPLVHPDSAEGDELSDTSHAVRSKKKKKKSRKKQGDLEEKREEALSLLCGYVSSEQGDVDVINNCGQSEREQQTGPDKVVKALGSEVVSSSATTVGNATIEASEDTPGDQELQHSDDTRSVPMDIVSAVQEVEKNTEKKRRRRRNRKRKSDKDSTERTSGKPALSTDKPQESFQRRTFPTRRAFSATLEGLGNHIQFESDDENNCDNSQNKKPKLHDKIHDNNVNGRPENGMLVGDRQDHVPGKVERNGPVQSSFDSSINKTLLLLAETPHKISQAQTNIQGKSDMHSIYNHTPSPSVKDHESSGLESPLGCDILSVSSNSSTPVVFQRGGAALAARQKSKRQATCLLPPGRLVGVEESQSASQVKPSHVVCNSQGAGSPSVDANKVSSTPKDYSYLDNCTGPPRKGDRIAYKVLELSDDYSPQVSSFKVATVLDYEESSRRAHMKLDRAPPRIPIAGKFHIEDSEETSVDTEESEVILLWPSLIEAKLLPIGE